jgi:hypothetical protein
MTQHLHSNCKIEDPLLFALYLAEDTTSVDGGQLWASLISNRWSRLGSETCSICRWDDREISAATRLYA